MSNNQMLGPMLALLVVVILFGLLMAGAAYVFARYVFQNAGAGWGRLLPRFAVEAAPAEGYRFATGRTVMVGSVVSKRCTRVGVGPLGLYLKVPWRTAVLIPWSEVRGVEPASLHLRAAHRLTIGAPPSALVTVFPEDLRAMWPFLEQPRAVAPTSAAPVAG